VIAALGHFCREKPLGAFGGLIVLGMLAMAVGADWIAPYSYEMTVPGARMQPPSAKFWMGGDNIGRDIWSRIVFGARVSVTVGFGAVALATVLATLIGVSSGYAGGAYDIVVQRVVDAWQSFPFLVVVLSIMAVLGPGMINVIIALGVLGAAGASRVIRGAAISAAANPYVEAARALGAGHLRIMLRHVLPNSFTPVLVLATLQSGAVVVETAGLSFLGLGAQPPSPDWGALLADGHGYFLTAWWIATFPGLAIFLVVVGFNLLGDALRDQYDPRLRVR
jgi:peptide/nickel transport system permease protein